MATLENRQKQRTRSAAVKGVRVSERTLLWLILGLYFALGLWYSVAVPAFETPDEIYHYAFSRHLSQGNWLPVQSEESTGAWEQEGSQAPLYYFLTGALIAGVDQSDFEETAVFNPRANMGNPLFPGNKNRMLYSAVHPALQGTNLALHLGRWLSLVMGGLTVWLVYRTGKLAFAPDSRLPLLAALTVAVLPQFVFISASFSNDNMVVVASAAVLYWLAYILTMSSVRHIRAWEWIALGVLLGLAALSKLQALGLFALAGAVGLAIAWRERSWRTFLVAALGCAVPAALIAGWWYWRNHALYGDWTGLDHLTAINGLRQKPLDLDDFWLEFRGVRYSFWGLFGWFNILLPSWFYAAMDVLTLVAISGSALALVRAARTRDRALLREPAAQVRLLLLGWIGLSAALLVYWMMRATGSQGRLIFPALSAIAIWYVIGLHAWLRMLPPLLRGAAWAVTPVLLLSMTMYGALVAIPAAYAAPRPVVEIPEQAQTTDIAFGENEALVLLAIETPGQRYAPGDSVPVTLYLSARETIQEDFELFIQLLDSDGNVLGNVTTHPGWGRNPTSLWEPGAIYADAYEVPITAPVDARSPLLARVYAGFIDPDTQAEGHHPLMARDAEGNEMTPLLGDVVIVPHARPSPEEFGLEPMDVVFGGALELSGMGFDRNLRAGEPFPVAALWTASTDVNSDFTAFVHLLDANGIFVAGHDETPAGGRFPTRYWRAGDRIIGELPVMLPDDLPTGDYDVWVGVYESSSRGESRLPVTDAGGAEVANDMVKLGTVSVEPR